ncbi:hypothetical protein P879_01622 [Paragonimus westermani]|uniref:Fibronectin type-III domain-containing protein n=1 Tax=Paragonimus westermani TaxID=34504 RepID=A0A8T0DUV5_9TREM|nr:hypothetical protein P879_01622 [Paragonimus westermani]
MIEWKDDSIKHAACAVNYVVIYKQMDGESKELNFQPHELPAVIGGLAEDTLYNYTVYTNLGWGLARSSNSAPVSLRTPKSIEKLEMPALVVSNSEHSITISWNATQHIEQFGVDIELSWTEGTNVYAHKFGSNSTEHLINNHDPSQFYRIQFNIYDASGSVTLSNRQCLLPWIRRKLEVFNHKIRKARRPFLRDTLTGLRLTLEFS